MQRELLSLHYYASARALGMTHGSDSLMAWTRPAIFLANFGDSEAASGCFSGNLMTSKRRSSKTIVFFAKSSDGFNARAPHHQRRRNQPSELHGTNLNNSAQVVPLFLLLDTLSQRYRYRNNIPFTTPLPSHSFLHKIQIYLSTEQVKPSHVQASRPRRR